MKPSIQSSSVSNPEAMNSAFAEAYNSGDINNLLSLYEPDGILINTVGGTVNGIENIRKTLEELLQLKGNMTSRNIYCIPFENIALLRAHFTLLYEGPDGRQNLLEGHTSEIVRKQSDGSWRYVIDHPFGSDLLERLGFSPINNELTSTSDSRPYI
ncbi:DUF4440 domain-containing protein [Paenibacillus sp. VCA1]|uniref:YybH family protein n=1 Tax=Paenibacillus sp. VCA1 TaxID=3039148 RepID=UPI002872696D|nr:nuclear transport factor 2 family protein [Paenibacillus sp. VCA1]MDR9854713.1 DUF4440 domain-containing protein [Paenibacillus sp. VCA1]